MESRTPNCDLLLECCPETNYFDIVEGLNNRFMHDAILTIFGYLDNNSLRNAELVSRGWRKVMFDTNPNKIWKNVLQQKIKSSNLWMSLHSSTVCQLNQLSTNNLLYFPKLFNKIDYAIQTLSKNWLNSDYTRDYLDYGLGLGGCLLRTGNKLIVLYDSDTRIFKIWNRQSLKLIEKYEYPSRMCEGQLKDEETVGTTSFELYEDMLVIPLMSGKIAIRNTIRKTIEEHKPIGMDDTKFITFLKAENGFLCASFSSIIEEDQSYNIFVWKFNSVASIDWENFKMIPLIAPDPFSRIHMDNKFFVLQKHYHGEVVCDIRTMSEPQKMGKKMGKKMKFKIFQAQTIYYDRCIAFVTQNSYTRTGNVSFVDIESGRLKLNIETNVDLFKLTTCIRIQSDFLIVCKDFGHPMPSKNILVWNLISAMKPDVDTSVPPYCVFEAFLHPAVFFGIDSFGIVVMNGMHDTGEPCRIMVINFLPLCGFCKKIRKTLRLCNRCKSTKYCGTICQNADWRHHKKMCHQICKPMESPTFPIGWNFGYFGNGTQ